MAVVLAVVSCQTEPEGLDINVGGEQETVVTVSLPEVTRATSADSGLQNVDAAKYDLRYIFEVYDVISGDTKVIREVKTTEVDITSVSFPVCLIAGRTYQFVVWADFVAEDTEDDLYYTTVNGLGSVAVVMDKWTANTEARDAYTDTKTITDYNGSKQINLSLTRPFGKLRAVTTDMDALKYINARPESVKFRYNESVYSKFNALTGEASEEVNKSFDYDLSDVDSYTEADDTHLTLFADYLFVGYEQKSFTTTFTMEVANANTTNVNVFTFNTDIPVKRNQLTTIIGSLITDPNDVKVDINDEFKSEEIILVGEYTLTEDLTISTPMIVKAGTEAVLNLNGHNIINETKSKEFGEGEGIVVYGNLTINGEGTIKGSTRAVWARGNNNATITINGGTYEGCEEGYTGGGNSVVYASSGNVINIYGGTVKALAADKTSYADKIDGVYAALNIYDRNGMINVYGGKFYKQNPAAPGTEPTDWNTAHPKGFVAEGYGAALRSDYYVVVPQVVADLNDVTAPTEVKLDEDLTVSTGTTINTHNATADITIDGNGKSIISTADSIDDFDWKEGGTIPSMSTVFSSANGSLVSVSNMKFEGTMSALSLGLYKKGLTTNTYKTELTNVDVINTEVVAYAGGFAPAVAVYGTVAFNNCNIYGTTLSNLDTHNWPVYDIVAANPTSTTINGGKIGSIYLLEHASLSVENGAHVDTILLKSYMVYNSVVIKAGTTVNTLDLSGVLATDPTKRRTVITIEDDATVGKIVANGVEYDSIDDFKNTTPVKANDTLSAAVETPNAEVVVAKGEYTFPSASIAEGVTIKCEEGTVFTGQSSLNINGVDCQF